MKKSALLALAALVCFAQAADYTKKTLTDKKPGYFEAVAEYPVWNVSNPLSKVANATMKDWTTKVHKAWVAETKKEQTEHMRQYGVWTHEIGFNVVRSDIRIISLVTSLDVYSGGAHPNHFQTTFNFANVKGKPTRLTLEDLFRPNSNPAKLVTEVVLRKLKAVNAEWVNEGTVKTLTKEQLNRFTIERDGLQWYFDPYEMGPYSSGNYEVKLNWAELGPDFNRALVTAK